MSLRYLLDTNICIYVAKHRPAEVYQRLSRLRTGEAGMSLITFGELYYGAQKSQQKERASEKLRQLIRYIHVLTLSAEAAEHYGMIRAFLEKRGEPIGNNDLWIAAHARSLNVTLVTNNMREFVRVPDLSVENWVTTQ